MEEAIAAVNALAVSYPDLDAQTAAAFALGFKAGRLATTDASETAASSGGGAAAAAAAPSGPNFAAPSSLPKIEEKWMIYDDDASFGKKAPNITTAEPLKDEAAKLGEKPTLVFFWAKSHKGDYTTIVGVSDLADKYGEYANFVGIGIDADKKDSQGLLKKIGTAMPNEYIDEFRVNIPLVWDLDKECKEAYRAVAKVMTITPSACFLIDTDRNIVWREQFGQGYAPKEGQLGEQLRRLIMGEELIKNGNAPVAEESEDDEDMAMGGDSDEDSDLGF
jgi:hypothetical protein